MNANGFPVPPGDIGIGVIKDGKLNIGGGFVYAAPCEPGKYIFTPFGTDCLLLTKCTSESSQLLSPISRGILLSGGPFHTQGYILPLSRIHAQNRSEKKNPELSSSPPEWTQEQREYPPLRKKGRGCSSPPALSRTNCLCKSSVCTGSHNNNKYSLFRKFETLVRSWAKSILKKTQRIGGTYA
jgi:hypothetical protein